VTLKSRLEVIQGYCKLHQTIDHMQVPIGFPQ